MKIVHISDLHFGMHHEHIATAFLEDLAILKPEIIIISGDLTHRARDEQYVALEKFLSQIKSPIITVPGNHDIPFYNAVARTFYPFSSYRNYRSPQLEPTMYNELISIFGANTVNRFTLKDGKLKKRSLKKAADFFSQQSTACNLLFFHHNFDYLEGLHKPLVNKKQFLQFLKKSSINIVCTGHLHFAHIGILPKENKEPCLLLHAGSLLCKRSKDGCNSYFVIDINEDKDSLVSWRVFEQTKFSIHKNYTLNLKEKNATLVTSV